MNNETMWGAIFDWDGVVVDSSAAHERSWEMLGEELGKELPPDHFKRGFGMKNVPIILNQLCWTTDPAEAERLGRRKEELYRELVGDQGIEPLAGARAWIETLNRNGIPCVVGSSTERANLEMATEVMGLGGRFRTFIASEDVSHGKPDPEVFLLCARALDLPPERCVVFEDTTMGIAAARAAGTRVVAVAGTNRPGKLQDADRIVHRLDELTVDDLGAWFT